MILRHSSGSLHNHSHWLIMWTWCHLHFSDCNAPYHFAGMHDPQTGTSYQRLSNSQERIMPVRGNATNIQSRTQRYDSGKYRWWECGSLGFESSGRREEGRCSSRKLASESFNALSWITVSHSLTNPNYKHLRAQRSHDLTGSAAFSGCSTNVFLSRFDEISRQWYVTLRPNEWALSGFDRSDGERRFSAAKSKQELVVHNSIFMLK